jgi:TetR/AcrR family transcriptional regulator, transcriptional repressor for nem operon
MTTKLATRQDTRTALLQAGMDVMLEKGYSNTGIQEVLSSLGVPKGSFYHYFESKENFAIAIIEHFDQECSESVRTMLKDQQKTPLQRLYNYCQNGKQGFLSQECRKGCLIGNLSQEMSDQSETLRKVLSAVMTKRQDLFADCIKEGQKLGEISQDWPADKLAEYFISSWSGAFMSAKTVKNIEPLDTFIDLMFNQVLKN